LEQIRTGHATGGADSELSSPDGPSDPWPCDCKICQCHIDTCFESYFSDNPAHVPGNSSSCAWR